MILPIPPEPEALKRRLTALKEMQINDASGDSSVIWAGNKLPKYLWDAWKKDLKPIGFTWQKFMQLLRYRTDVGVMWIKGLIPWEEFVKKVDALIGGPIGKDLQKYEPRIPSRDLAQWQFPPVADWEKFERLCRDLWAEIWRNPEAQRNGRTGQPQAGVDVYGTIDRGDKWGGVQCKKRDAYADSSLTERELYEIVEAAKAFKPPLSRFTVAYTGRRDARLQEAARKITENHRALGLFQVDICSWDDILEVVGNYPSVAKKHLQLGTVSSPKLDEVIRSNQAILEQQADQSVSMAEIKSAVMPSSGDMVSRVAYQAIQVTTDASAVTHEHNAELDHVKELVDKFQPKEALDYIEKLEKRIPSHIGGPLRYRLLANKAVAKAGIGQEHEAALLFIEAHQYNPDDERALCNRATGHLLLDQIDDAIRFVNRVLEKNPTSERAYEVLTYCACAEASLDQVIERIPKSLRETEGVAHAIAQQARQRGDRSSSIHWLEIAIKKAPKTKPDFLANLAGMFIESVADKFEVLSGAQITSADKAKLERAVSLLNQAIDAVANTETIKFRISWLVNRSTAHMLLAQIDSAVFDIDHALKLDPHDAALLKQKAALLTRAERFDQAVEIMNSIANNPDVPEVAIILAETLFEIGRYEDGIRVLKDSLAKTDSIPTDLRIEENRLLLHTYLQRKDFENARRVSSSLRSLDPTDILNLVLAARIEKATGEMTVATQLLNEALTYVSKATPSRYLIELSSELYAAERYADVWPLLENVADVRQDNPLTHRLLFAYYRSGEFEKALAACRGIPSKQKSLFATQIEVAIFEDIGDLTSAAAVCDDYIALHPDDLPMQVRRAVTLFRLGECDRVDAFLRSTIDIQQLPLDIGMQLAGIYAERGMSRRSLEVAYEVRRTYYNEGDAHLKYIGLFFGREKDVEPWLERTVVIEDTAVGIRDGAGPLQWYVIENRSHASAVGGELNVNDSLAAKLLGKKVNDEVELSNSAFSRTVAVVVEIKSKYVHALHDSLNLFPIRFAQVPGLQRVTVDAGGGEHTRKDFQKILDVIAQRDKQVREVEKLYLEGRITIGTFSNLIGKNVIDICGTLAGDLRRGIRYCTGTAIERDQALQLIKDNRRIAVDITALLTCRGIETLDLLKTVFTEILIGQSTIDLLQEGISERRGLASKGFMTVWKEEEAYYRRDVTAEEISQEIERLEHLTEWVRNNCSITPCTAAPKLGAERRKELENMIGKSFLEALLIAQEHACPLYCDDFATRTIGVTEFGVSGFWTQALAIHAHEVGIIDLDKYNGLTIQLAALNYRHTTINGAVLVEAARRSEWFNKHPFTSVLNTLNGSQIDIRSVVNVAAEFIFLLWMQLIPDFQRDALIVAVLDALTQKRKRNAVLALLEAVIKSRFRLLPLAEVRVRQVMTAWRSLRL